MLVHAQHPRPSPLAGLLPLDALLECTGLLMRTAKIIQILDLVNSDDPVLAGKGLLHRAELRALGRQTDATDAVGGLAGREERIVVVVRHLVHERVLHRRRCFVVDAVFAASGEEVALLDLIGPDAWVRVSAWR